MAPLVTVICNLAHSSPRRVGLSNMLWAESSRNTPVREPGRKFMTTQLIQPTSTLHKEAKVEKRISLTKIMVLTDFSKVSDLALQYAVALARQFDARIYLTHIVTRFLPARTCSGRDQLSKNVPGSRARQSGHPAFRHAARHSARSPTS